MHPIEGRLMKSRTVDGDCSRFKIICFREDVVIIEKIILSSDNLTKYGFKKAMQRSFFGKHIWFQAMSFKLNSLIAIAAQAYDIKKDDL